jgi:hypothetical protein
MPIYKWVTLPPITEVPLDQVQATVQEFQNSVAPIGANPGEYGTFSANKANAGIGISDGFKNSFVTPMARVLAARLQRRVFRYNLDGLPVGLIDIQIHADRIDVDHVVGHPGTENAGDILIEYILQFSRVNPPVVALFAASDHPAHAYRKIGFANKHGGVTGHGSMILDLGGHGAGYWAYVGNRWKLAAEINSGYMANRSHHV